MARWHFCNVLHVGPVTRQVWQFDARNGKFPLNREQASRAGEPLPVRLIAKDWRSLFRPKLNVVWLPPEHVFLRVAQFPQSNLEETRAMVELQLEKLSPIPVTQALWTTHILPHAAGNMQTVVVIIVARSVIEEFLGKLEGQGFMADRLELPVLDQLHATTVSEDGAWIYPEAQGGKNTALAAWWYGGVLRSLDLITLSPGPNGATGLKDQLMQMAWAGEFEGWLTSPPRWHLVADTATAAEWEPPLRQGLEQPIDLTAPLSAAELAARTAKRAAQTESKMNLLPAEFAARYQQQFVDRLWMRGLGTVLTAYLAGLAIYFIAVGVLNYQTTAVGQRVQNLGPAYTNSIRLGELYKVLDERRELQFAALDCWNALAELMPENLTLDSLNFSDGKQLKLMGTAPASQVDSVYDLSTKLRKATTAGNQPLFDANGDQPSVQVNLGMARWSFGLELKRTAVE